VPIEIIAEKWGPEPGQTSHPPYTQRLYRTIFRHRDSGTTKIQWAVAEDHDPNEPSRRAQATTGWADEAPEWEPARRAWRAEPEHLKPLPRPQVPSAKPSKSSSTRGKKRTRPQ
jgi:hypothetical protein